MPIFIATALGFLKRIPWWAFLLIAAMLAAWWLLLDDRHWHKLADQRAATIAQVQVAQKQAEVAQKQAIAAQEQRYKDLANAADTHHHDNATVASDATTAFADTHRVREQAASCPSSTTVASAPRVDPGVSASVPASTDVVISNDDLHRCTDAYVYALSAHDWAVGLNQ